jgi:hypothetical protein
MIVLGTGDFWLLGEGSPEIFPAWEEMNVDAETGWFWPSIFLPSECNLLPTLVTCVDAAAASATAAATGESNWLRDFGLTRGMSCDMSSSKFAAAFVSVDKATVFEATGEETGGEDALG